ncbi:hypothetical protein [Chitinasiproducens palmae]|uniref:Uncharacterized protein n=1 Tax=Chitinasiproducens palmae TaxID=1770053 RepID=A0A1H2PMC5_9BURK|nr:hypothetical protein [Chitinasiproducens palmae]SDV47694.1 hypothetical protein SAMN05216551_103224 [Chitinasiproducens palmae]
MKDPTYRKGPYTARVLVEALDDGTFQGLVAIEQDGAAPADAQRTHQVESRSSSQAEAFDEAHALAHRLLADLGEGTAADQGVAG